MEPRPSLDNAAASTNGDAILKFMLHVGKLKTTPRTGWLRFIPNPESVADHTFRVAYLSLFAPLFVPEGIDVQRCIFLALCHDLAEAVVGDIPTYANVPKERKHKLEATSFGYVDGLLGDSVPDIPVALREAWAEYEKGETPEARFVKEADKLECLIQAYEYEEQTLGQKDLGEFQGLCNKVQSPQGKALLECLQLRRSRHFAPRQQVWPGVFLIGDAEICREQGACLAREDNYTFVSFDEVLQTLSKKSTYKFATFLSKSLEIGGNIPDDLAIEILMTELEKRAVAESSRFIVHGFLGPDSRLMNFRRKISTTTRVLHVCSMRKLDTDVHRQTCEDNPNQLPSGIGTLCDTDATSKSHTLTCDWNSEEARADFKRIVEAMFTDEKSDDLNSRS